MHFATPKIGILRGPVPGGRLAARWTHWRRGSRSFLFHLEAPDRRAQEHLDSRGPAGHELSRPSKVCSCHPTHSAPTEWPKGTRCRLGGATWRRLEARFFRGHFGSLSSNASSSSCWGCGASHSSHTRRSSRVSCTAAERTDRADERLHTIAAALPRGSRPIHNDTARTEPI